MAHDRTDSGKPIGSGKFSRNVGVAFILAGALVVLLDYLKVPLKPVYILGVWLVAAGAIAIRWGMQRIEERTNPEYDKDKRIGQETINMIVGMVAATFVIAAIVFDSTRREACPAPGELSLSGDLSTAHSDSR